MLIVIVKPTVQDSSGLGVVAYFALPKNASPGRCDIRRLYPRYVGRSIKGKWVKRSVSTHRPAPGKHPAQRPMSSFLLSGWHLPPCGPQVPAIQASYAKVGLGCAAWSITYRPGRGSGIFSEYIFVAAKTRLVKKLNDQKQCDLYCNDNDA